MTNMAALLTTETGDNKAVIILQPVTIPEIASLPAATQAWAKAIGFDGAAGQLCPVASADGTLERVLYGLGDEMPTETDKWWLAAAAEKLQAGTYKIEGNIPAAQQARAAYGWCLAQYQFNRYFQKKPAEQPRILLLPANTETRPIVSAVETATLVRNLVNTPTDDFGPADLQDTAESLAETYGGTCSTIVGEDLLDENFPAIHAVGRAAAEGREPRLIDLRWGDSDTPVITLVGKGVCYDTGGLDIKPGSGMKLMKKDMGGAAHALGLARLIMEAGLKVRLRVLIPAVENAIAGNSYRPGDIIATRKGLFVEVGNTDAEGRIVLCDALALAGEENPDLILNFATLTGAARVALGPDLPATYSNSESLWTQIETGSKETHDPLWRLPLWAPYDEKLASPIADLSNISSGGGFAGSITAALYLQRFVTKGTDWAHFDLYAWEPDGKPGRPKGAAAQAIFAAFHALKTRFSLDA